jgi:putative tricarboxylic transport membrane protein
MYSNLIFSLLFIILSWILYMDSWTLPKPRFDPLGAGFFPRMIFLIMIILCLFQLTLALRTLWRQRKSKLYHLLIFMQIRNRLREYRLITISFAFFAIYLVLIPYLGFALATFVYLIAFQQLLFPRPYKGLPRQFLITGISTFLITYVFKTYFQVFLPPGILL